MSQIGLNFTVRALYENPNLQKVKIVCQIFDLSDFFNFLEFLNDLKLVRESNSTYFFILFVENSDMKNEDFWFSGIISIDKKFH